MGQIVVVISIALRKLLLKNNRPECLFSTATSQSDFLISDVMKSPFSPQQLKMFSFFYHQMSH